MTSHFAIVLAIIHIIAASTCAQQDAPSPQVGDTVVIELTGNPARSYLEACEMPEREHLLPTTKVVVPLESRIMKKNDNQIVSVAFGSKAHLGLSVETVFNIEDIQHPPVVISLAEGNAFSESERQAINDAEMRRATLPRIRKDTFKGVTIRHWSLVEEVTR